MYKINLNLGYALTQAVIFSHADSRSFAAAAVLLFFLKTASNSLYERIKISNSRGVKNADLFLLLVAMVNRGIGAPLMTAF